MSKIFHLRRVASPYFNQFSVFTFLSILVHQSFIALSVYASIKLIRSINGFKIDENNFNFWLVVYVVSMVLPHVAASLSDVFNQKWICGVFKVFWLSSVDRYKASTSPFIKGEPLGVLSSQGKEIISDFIGYISFGTSAFLNFFLSLIVISVFIDARFIISIAISAMLVVLIKYLVSRKLEAFALRVSESGSGLVSLLSLTHDNTHHGSRVSYAYFIKKLKNKIDVYLASRVKEEVFQSSVMLIIAFASLMPTTLLVLYILLKTGVGVGIKLAIVINLTRIYQLLNSATEIVSIVISFSSFKGRLKMLSCFAKEIEKPAFSFNDNVRLYKGEKLFDQNELTPKGLGRFSLKGKNGSGKSNFLKAFRDKYDAIYFNPSFKVMYPWEETSSSSLSDGQYSKKCILWLLSHTKGPLLLDEWDAFLDQENTKTVNAEIEKAAKSRLIMEVRQ
ncbi:hypothetical protein MSP8886_00584 [Marinomonas spartinae]|uniref:Uncharacterized protein n=1 Tax=Marinomonas spartinae TaxID=1792290 RepID=A0A1A8T3H3_9GAMM|nr:ABC transporter ATP-binding protein [Marinomonas spartinae]SBS26372.1 hypothetical protein MSP8886_00584 [Marinomonas spartinae]